MADFIVVLSIRLIDVHQFAFTTLYSIALWVPGEWLANELDWLCLFIVCFRRHYERTVSAPSNCPGAFFEI